MLCSKNYYTALDIDRGRGAHILETLWIENQRYSITRCFNSFIVDRRSNYKLTRHSHGHICEQNALTTCHSEIVRKHPLHQRSGSLTSFPRGFDSAHIKTKKLARFCNSYNSSLVLTMKLLSRNAGTRLKAILFSILDFKNTHIFST